MSFSFDPPAPLSDVFSPLHAQQPAQCRIQTRSSSYSSSTTSTTSSSSSIDTYSTKHRIVFNQPRRYEALKQLKVRATFEMPRSEMTDSGLTALPEGTVVLVTEVRELRAKISRPLTGWVSIYNHRNGERLLVPCDLMHSKIGGKVKYLKPIRGQMPNKDGVFHLGAKIVDYDIQSGLYKALYPDMSYQWINLSDPNIEFIAQQKINYSIKAGLGHDVLCLDEFTSCFNEAFLSDYPELCLMPVDVPSAPLIDIDVDLVDQVGPILMDDSNQSVFYDHDHLHPASNQTDQFVTSICSSQQLIKPNNSSSSSPPISTNKPNQLNPPYSPLPVDYQTPIINGYNYSSPPNQITLNTAHSMYDQTGSGTQSATSPPSTYFPFPLPNNAAPLPPISATTNDSSSRRGGSHGHVRRGNSGDSTGKIIRIVGLNPDRMPKEDQARQLFTLCSVYGVVKKVKVDYRERGVAYIEFHTKDQAKNVIDNLDGLKLYGKLLKVVLSTHFKIFPAKDSPRTKRDYPHAPLLNKCYKYSDRKRKHCDDSPSSSASPSNVLHIANVPPQTTTPDALRSFLNSETHKDLVRSVVFFGASDDSPTCQAFAECADSDHAAQILIKFHGRRYCGRDITISFSTRSHMPTDNSLVSSNNSNSSTMTRKVFGLQPVGNQGQGEKGGPSMKYKGGFRSGHGHRTRWYRQQRFLMDSSQSLTAVQDRMRYRRNNADLHKVLNR